MISFSWFRVSDSSDLIELELNIENKLEQNIILQKLYIFFVI